MNKGITSKFFSKPSVEGTWLILVTGLASFLFWPFMTIFSYLFRFFTDPSSIHANTYFSPGILGALFSLGLAIFTIIRSIKNLKLGERSWAFWIGFISSIIIAGFWAFMFLGEILFPH